jgi:adenylate cyclase
VVFFGPDRAMRWFFVYVAMIVVCVVVDPFVRVLDVTPYSLSLTFWAVDTIGPAVIGFLIIRYVDRQRRQAQARSEELLLNVLPAPIAERLRSGERTIAQQHAEVSVLFADVVDFTPCAEATDPSEVVDMLNDLFSDFDALADRFGMEKIKTIGDAYMAVAGVPSPR